MYTNEELRYARENAFPAFFPSEGTVPRERYSTQKESDGGVDEDYYYDEDEDALYGDYGHLALDTTVSEIDDNEYEDTEVEVSYIKASEGERERERERNERTQNNKVDTVWNGNGFNGEGTYTI
jgi:hypothetical protein